MIGKHLIVKAVPKYEVGPITRSIACIIGRNGPFKQVDLGGLVDPSLNLPGCSSPPVFVCSYVPSSVEIM
ncbi:unnamed protein product [Brassica rapa]|uniref:Uncharacterized protein n=2 Tax=Brassica TaxID=3705 RepID=A0A3P5YID0_BRACM|nr:unnamed protein product [Brassica napus]CAG7866428.1 unnamed protein product [Brassica rapa]CDY34784.1 BnaA09g41510D [Brassica napus]VDC63424.1 unnamed protein product [Brassica rapa]